MMGPEINTTGWWTLGLSVSSNGAIHYYARSGVEDLTPDDYITSQYPYGYRAERFRAAFFNVINGDNGRDWSTTWVIDDTFVYLGTGPAQVARRQPAPINAQPARMARAATQNTPSSTERRKSNSSESESSSTDKVSVSELDLDYFRDEPR